MEPLSGCTSTSKEKVHKKTSNTACLWTAKTTALFLKSRLLHDDLFILQKSRRAGNLGWKTVVSDIRLVTGNKLFSIANVSKKWWNMCRIYKDYKQIMDTSRVSWPYYYTFDSYFQSKKNTNDNVKCKLCFKEKGVFSIKTFEHLSEHIEKYLDLKVAEEKSEDGFVCIPCKMKIDNFHLFFLQCHEVNKELHLAKDKIQKNETIPTSTITVLTTEASDTKMFNKGILLNSNGLEIQEIFIKNEEEEDISYEDHEVVIDETFNTKKEPVIQPEPSLEEIFNINNDLDPLKNEFQVKQEHSMETQIAEINNEFKCSCCIEKFDTKGELSRHFKLTHVRWECTRDGCEKKFRGKRSLEEHTLKFHEGKNSYLCTVCGKGFNNKSNLKAHEIQHSGIKNFKCDLCEKAYFSSHSLFIHKKKIHFKVLSFCSKCMKPFKSDSALKRHEIVHTGIKRFNCTYDESCEYSCFTKRELTIHERRHEGKRPHSCSICLKSFSQKHHLRDHERIHSGEKPYTCLAEGCERKFVTKGKMTKHMKIHNK